MVLCNVRELRNEHAAVNGTTTAYIRKTKCFTPGLSGLTHVRHKSSPGFVFQNQEIIVTSLCVSLLELVLVHRVKVTWCALGNIEK